MREPCKTCDERTVDHGGCRCQAYLLTGDAAAADPVCSKSADHDKIEQVVKLARRPVRDENVQPLIFRSKENSLRIG